ncbi:hypothetical protein BDZ45DRAFT_646778 [Acephala macrosclerotiorum]|nr:hypothetical protein BDZ45DRAFT_646778 [Acephala macrosclerotiorum]
MRLIPIFAGLASAGIINSILKTNEPAKALTSWSYDLCGSENDAITLHSITLSPDPPIPGSPLNVSISFAANTRILSGAYLNVVVKIGYLKLLKQTVDLCEENGVLKDTGVSCPVEEGEHVIEKKVDLPREIPPAKYTVNAVGFTVEDEDMFCVNIYADFLTSFGRADL